MPSPTSQPEAAVVVVDASVTFDDQVAVDGISLVVPAGIILGIIGPSGAGKTTLVRLHDRRPAGRRPGS